MANELTTLAQFGFAAVAFWMVWVAYREVQPKLLEIIRQNAEAMQRVAGALEQLTKSQDAMHAQLGRLDDRLLLLEEQHKHPTRECPLQGRDEELDRALRVAKEAFSGR